jgi:hypothetical protein
MAQVPSFVMFQGRLEAGGNRARQLDGNRIDFGAICWRQRGGFSAQPLELRPAYQVEAFVKGMG